MADYLKIPELARRLDVSEKTARRYVRAGTLPSTFIGGAYRVTEEDLKTFLHGAEVKPESIYPKDRAPSSTQPPLNGFAEEWRDYGGRVWERINLLDDAAKQWQRFIDEGLYDLNKLDLETLKAVDAVSLKIVLDHAPDAAAMKRASTDEQRERLEQAERRLIDANLEFWTRVEHELAREQVAYFEAFKAQREEEWEQASKNSRIA